MPRSRITIARNALVACALLALLVAAVSGCGGSTKIASADGSAASAETSTDGSTGTTSTKASSEEAMLKFAKCMRDQGVDFPDPTTDANGNLRFQRPSGGNANAAALRPAFAACSDLLKNAQIGPGAGGNQTEFQDSALKFAQCLRGKGLNVPDPDFSSGGPPSGFQNLDTGDPKVKAAIDACQSNLTIPGGGPGGK